MGIFEIGNLGDERRLLLNSNSISQSSSQADLLDSNSVTSDTPKSPLPSSSSREILDVFSNRNNRRAVSVNDIRRAFEKAEQSLSNSGTPKRLGLATPSSHNRMSSQGGRCLLSRQSWLGRRCYRRRRPTRWRWRRR